MIIDSSKNGRWIIPFKKFSRLRVKLMSLLLTDVPEPSGGSTVTFTGNLGTADIVITCNMNANPSVTTYRFYDSSNTLLQSSSSNTYTVTVTQGYGTYSCNAQNSRGSSATSQSLVVQQETAGNVLLAYFIQYSTTFN